ncbi:hypothetical protein NMG60_11012843 [Bertholletia excelsa]
MEYRHNEAVEVIGKGEGHVGSFYPATLLAAIGRNKYLVRYKTRFTEDKTRALTDVLEPADIRPAPPEINFPKFAVGDRVEAYVNGGWRVGQVTSKVDPNYYVKLDGTANEVHCAFYSVRVHLEWRDGKWNFPAKRL